MRIDIHDHGFEYPTREPFRWPVIPRSGEKIILIDPRTQKVLFYTDIGRDVDDLSALTYLVGAENTELVGIITTHMIPDRRAMIARTAMNELGFPAVPIGVGSIFPLGAESEMLTRYLHDHRLGNKTYEGQGLIDCFPDGVDLINELIRKYGKSLRIAAVAPLTDLAKAADKDPKNFASVGAIYIQGQAAVDDNSRLVPDPVAYNIREDLSAAERVFGFQGDIPMTLIGKHAAYAVPLDVDDFDRFANTGHPVGGYLKTSAEAGLDCFAERKPDIFKNVFGDRKQLTELSKPYDVLVAQAIAKPGSLTGRRVGNHSLIGMSPEDSGVSNPEAIKQDLVDTITRALTK